MTPPLAGTQRTSSVAWAVWRSSSAAIMGSPCGSAADPHDRGPIPDNRRRSCRRMPSAVEGVVDPLDGRRVPERDDGDEERGLLRIGSCGEELLGGRDEVPLLAFVDGVYA